MKVADHQTRGKRPHTKAKRKTQSKLCQAILTIALMASSFYFGILVGMHSSLLDCELGNGEATQQLSQEQIEELVRKKVKEGLDRDRKIMKDAITNASDNENGGEPERRFASGLDGVAVGLARTGANDFLDLFDYGIPRKSFDGEEVMVIYKNNRSLPSDNGRKKAVKYDDGNGIPMLSAADATANCDTLKVVTTQLSPTAKCIALVSQPEGPIQTWHKSELVPGVQYPHFQQVGVGVQNGKNQFYAPLKRAYDAHERTLEIFLASWKDVKSELAVITKKLNKKKPVITLVCNLGQSALLSNFICAARSKGFDLSNVIVFATDKETKDIAEGLGLLVYYNKRNFESLPTGEALVYGDSIFSKMMIAKVVPIVWLLRMKFDVVFQDVDVVWYKDSVSLFESDTRLVDFDVIFQDDGARSLRYSPFFGNSGFYFIRNNPKTVHLFTTLLYHGAEIVAWKSHQQVLGALLNEHSSRYGLRVKVLEGASFPGGFHYHRDHSLMTNIAQGKSTPYLFHMSWTKNKADKVLFMQQMGLWYLQDHCVDDKAIDVLKGQGDFIDTCCSKDPLVTCHYKDKPSIVPCKDSLTKDEGGKNFWTW